MNIVYTFEVTKFTSFNNLPPTSNNGELTIEELGINYYTPSGLKYKKSTRQILENEQELLTEELIEPKIFIGIWESSDTNRKEGWLFVDNSRYYGLGSKSDTLFLRYHGSYKITNEYIFTNQYPTECMPYTLDNNELWIKGTYDNIYHKVDR